MEEKNARRAKRPAEERKADYETKIAFHKEMISKLEAKISDLDKPRKPRISKKQALILEKLESGAITKEEAVVFGFKE